MLSRKSKFERNKYKDLRMVVRIYQRRPLWKIQQMFEDQEPESMNVIKWNLNAHNWP